MNIKYFTGFEFFYHLTTWLMCSFLILVSSITACIIICVGLYKVDIRCIESAAPFIFISFILFKTFQWVYAYKPKEDNYEK